jgi:hypothetical protein
LREKNRHRKRTGSNRREWRVIEKGKKGRNKKGRGIR